LATILCVILCSGPIQSAHSAAPDRNFKLFVAEKEELAKLLSKKHDLKVRPVVWEYFAAVKGGDWTTSSNLFFTIEAGSGRYDANARAWLPLQIWGPIHDTFGAYEQFVTWHPTLLERFGRAIIDSIPSNSIYFGGTDAGRFIISALSQSHGAGRPFFTLTQNTLADASYMDYLREMYGTKIYIPTGDDAARVFNDYLKDAERRSKQNQLKEGEEVKKIDGRITVSGQVAVMAINERLVKLIIDKNPGHEFYLEESMPLENLYAHSTPHGLIFRLNNSPIERLPQSVIDADRKFWNAQTKGLTGSAIDESITVQQLCSRTERVYLGSNFASFAGNPRYVKDAQAPQYFSKCRGAIASLYQWRSTQGRDKEQSNALSREADLAHRQAIALCPYNVEVVRKYVDYLLGQHRTNDAKTLIQTTFKIEPEKRMDLDSETLRNSLAYLRRKGRELDPIKP
jgi:hypothetical protein